MLALVGYAYVESKEKIKELYSAAQFQLEVSQEASSTLMVNTEQQLDVYDYYMRDDSKVEYRSLVPILEQLTTNTLKMSGLNKKIIKRLTTDKLDINQQNTIVPSFVDSARALMNESRAVLKYYFVTNADIYGMHDKEIAFYEQNVFDQLRFTHWPQKIDNLASSNTANINVLTSLLLDMNIVVDQVVNTLTSMLSGRRITFSRENLGIYQIKVGKSTGDEVVLMLQSPGCSYEYTNPKSDLKINEKVVEFDFNGIAIYRGTRDASGQLKIDYRTVNPLTGKTYEEIIDYQLNGKHINPIIP